MRRARASWFRHSPGAHDGLLARRMQQLSRVAFLLLCIVCAAFQAAAPSAATDTLAWDVPTTSGAGFKALAATADGALFTVGTRHATSETVLLCRSSTDCGTSWTLAGLVTSDADPHADLGDAMLMVTQRGSLFCSYRRNHVSGRALEDRSFAIEVSKSNDGGRNWSSLPTIAECSGTTYGLWSSFLLQKHDGTMQCYFDDEVTPAKSELRRHQWLTMKTWNAASYRWENPVTVSRAQDSAALSRDGMCSVVELPDTTLLCVFESVDTEVPNHGCIRSVISSDGGGTWSWRSRERAIVYQPADKRFNALAPWLAQVPGGELMCCFVTDEDRAVPDIPATGKLDENLKAVYSRDLGRSWSPRPQTISEIHPSYVPGVAVLNCEGQRRAVVQYATRYGAMIQRATLPPDR